MNSSTSRTLNKKLIQEEIKKQIALLQSCLEPEPEPEVTAQKQKSPKRKASKPTILAPPTPSPRKKRKLGQSQLGDPLSRPAFRASTQNISSTKTTSLKEGKDKFKKLAPSNFITNLATIKHVNDDDGLQPRVVRTAGFKDQPAAVSSEPIAQGMPPRRNERLEVIEDLQPGPYEHNPPSDDPNFDTLEPNSGIRLSSRSISYNEFNDHLLGRYYLSPSRLYSTIQLLPDKQAYDVPVPGDWITIAVVAERGPIKFTRPPPAIEKEQGDPENHSKWKGKNKDHEQEKPSGKKYISLKLIDFGARSGSSSSNNRTSSIRGDAFLSLLLFESDSFDFISRVDGRKPEKMYKGGSRGAFEHLTNVKEGDVIALLNPKILKPFQRSNDAPHPINNILAITPESAATIMVIGCSKDLGMCNVRKQDGKVCGSWCDKRISEVCEYHIQHAVQRQRAARPEFSIGTSGMSITSKYKSKNKFDPLRKWGLQPSEDSGLGSTYVVSGHVVSGSSSDPRTMYLSETIGREGQAKAKRISDSKNADKELKKLLQRDKEGMKAVLKARQAAKKQEKSLNKSKGKGKETGDGQKAVDFDDSDDELFEEEKVHKSSYSASIIRTLGFDPSIKPGQRKAENKKVQEKLAALEALQKSRKDIDLGSKPGPRVRSGVVAPNTKKAVTCDSETRKDHVDINLDDDYPDTGLPGGLWITKENSATKVVDLDDL